MKYAGEIRDGYPIYTDIFIMINPCVTGPVLPFCKDTPTAGTT